MNPVLKGTTSERCNKTNFKYKMKIMTNTTFIQAGRRIVFPVFAILGLTSTALPSAAAAAPKPPMHIIAGKVVSARPPTLDPTYGLPLPQRQAPAASAPVPHWIWASHTVGDQTVLARGIVTLARTPKSARLAVTADDRFTLFINGLPVDQTQSKEDGWQNAHVLSVGSFLKPGRNIIAIAGVNSGGGAAGILARLDVDGTPRLLSGADWKVLESPNRPAGWNTAAFDDAAWPAATVEDPLGGGPWANNVSNWPDFSRDAWYMAHMTIKPVAMTPVAANQVSGGAANAQATLVDFGQEYAGRLRLTGAAGVPITVTTGESRAECFHAEPGLDNNGPSSLTLAGAKAVTTPYSAFRYALIKFSGPAAPISVVLDHKYYPVAYRGAFSCSDPLLTKIWYTGAYTAHLCMQEDIWDAPKRDRGLWCGDLHVTGETINNAFGDRFLMEKSIRELREIAQSGLPDDALPKDEINGIPGYTAAWYCELADFYRHNGDDAFLRSQHAKIISLLEYQKTDFTDSLFTNPRDKWDYCDWAPDYVQRTPLTRAATNLFIIKGVREAVFLLRSLGDTASADKYTAWADTLTQAARSNLLDPKTQTYSDRVQGNAMAVYSGVATPEQQARIYQTVLKAGTPAWTVPVANDMAGSEVMSPYYGNYVLQAYGKMGQCQAGINLVRRYWGAMLSRGATTWWEEFDPSLPQDMNLVLDKMPYLSLSHGWSSGPTSFLTEYVLGVQPTAGGFKSVVIQPNLGDLKWAAGTVPTPHGAIQVRADKAQKGIVCTLTLPSGVHALVKLPGRTVALDHAGKYVIKS